ncbi:universal stress protein [Streptomyces sp. NPDC056227]|uniref:universal stress protein n=1 Tax=Streptomyces sp. NPDC056227 TaxID=3345753 RepID=UPI0035DE513D
MNGTIGSPELGSVIVGVDGSEPARRAALWAAAEAARRDSPLRIVYAADTDSWVLYLSAEKVRGTDNWAPDRRRGPGEGIAPRGSAGDGRTVIARFHRPPSGGATHSLLQHAHCPVQLIPRHGSGHGSES